MDPQIEGLMPVCPSSHLHPPRTTEPSRPASLPAHFVVYFHVSSLPSTPLRSKQRNVSLKGSLSFPPAPWPLATLSGAWNVPGRARAPCHSVASALWPYTPSVSSDHSHCPLGTQARNLPSAEWADSRVSSRALSASPVPRTSSAGCRAQSRPRKSAPGEPPSLMYLQQPIYAMGAEQA